MATDDKTASFLGQRPASDARLGVVFAGSLDGAENGGSGAGDANREDARFDDAGTIDPVEITRARGKRRGRKPGISNADYARARETGESPVKATLAVEPPDVSPTVVGQISQALFGIHQMLAIGLAAPEIVLSEGEAEALAKCIAGVGKYYIRIAADNKLAAWLALLLTSAMIYVPRVMAVQRRNDAMRAPKAARPIEPDPMI